LILVIGLRADCADMLRWAAMISPEMMFQFIASRIEEQLKKPIDRGEGIYSYFLN